MNIYIEIYSKINKNNNIYYKKIMNSNNFPDSKVINSSYTKFNLRIFKHPLYQSLIDSPIQKITYYVNNNSKFNFKTYFFICFRIRIIMAMAIRFS